MATSLAIAHQLPFEDTFHDLNQDLDMDVKEWPYLNNFYIQFGDGIPANRAQTSRPEQESEKQLFPMIVARIQTISEQNNDQRYFQDIPEYLWPSDSDFHTKFFCELRHPRYPLDFEDLQQLAILSHQTCIIRLHEQLWHCFLQAGQGLLLRQPMPHDRTSSSTTLPFWPKMVTSIMISQGILPAHHNDEQDQVNPNIYIDFVQNYLRQLEQQAKQRRLKFDIILKRLSGQNHESISDKIESLLEAEESLIALRLHFEIRITLLKFICMDRSYQLAYFQQKPTHSQLQIANQICSVTHAREKASREMYLYKFDFLYKKFPKTFDILEAYPPTLITDLSDRVIRQKLSDQYQETIRQAKDNLLFIYTRASEARNDEYQKKFDQTMANMWKNQREQPADERLTPTMLAIIERRQININECMKELYRLKNEFYVKVPLKTFPGTH